MTNQDAFPVRAELDGALAIYRDAMRRFIVNRLRERYKEDDNRLAEEILEILKDYETHDADYIRAKEARDKGDKPENFFEEKHFTLLMFRTGAFNDISKPGVNRTHEQNRIAGLGPLRNVSGHRGFEDDLEPVDVLSRVGDMITVLELIGAPESVINDVRVHHRILMPMADMAEPSEPEPVPAEPSLSEPEPTQAQIDQIEPSSETIVMPPEYQSSETIVMPPEYQSSETMVMPITSMFGLLITEGLDKGKSIRLKEGCNTIGRSPENDLQTDDPYVSGYHTAVIMEEDDFTLLDLGSAGGTSIGQNRIAGRRIEAGSVITVGQTKLFVSVVDDPGPVSLGATMVAPPSGPPSLKLTAQSGPDEGQNFPLSDSSNIIGRPDDSSPDPEVSLSDQTVSRRHALVYVGADRVAIADLGSRSGTRVDGYSVSSGVQIKMGDRVEIGQSEFTLTRNSVG